MNYPSTRDLFKIGNIRYFIAFRIFFNARFYYPVFTILFLDFGLSLEQFALLNVAWAITIVLLEVPSGALADVVGRRNLLIFASAVMVIEIALMGFAPMGNITLLFVIFFINRILSGAAEAAASGADEALAYDTLAREGDENDWGLVLEKEMRYKSIAFVIAMSLGAAVYDHSFVNRVLHWMGSEITLTQDMTLRFPLFLTLIMAVIALWTTLRMKEPPRKDALVCVDFETCKNSVSHAFKLTIQAGKWILQTPFAFVVILSVMIFDHIIRMVVTLDSQYFRLIHLPEASFGLIGSGMSVLGIFIPRIALKLAESRSPGFNLGVTFLITLVALSGMALFIPFAGLLPSLFLFCAFYLLGFYASYYLNRITDSDQRATVLSFKGLSLNVGYGLIGILYSLLVAVQRSRISEAQPNLLEGGLERSVFIASFAWFPLYFIVMMGLLLLFARRHLRN